MDYRKYLWYQLLFNRDDDSEDGGGLIGMLLIGCLLWVFIVIGIIWAGYHSFIFLKEAVIGFSCRYLLKHPNADHLMARFFRTCINRKNPSLIYHKFTAKEIVIGILCTAGFIAGLIIFLPEVLEMI